MSSMRNAVQRRNHKERAQPAERAKWGILEKHKDYSIRAADFNAKKKRLRALKTKATEKNPDEFHFGMVSGRTRDGGIHVAERESTKKAREAGRDVELMRGLKAQDAGYLSVVLARERAVLARLEVAAGTEIGGDGGLVGGERPGEVLGKRKRGGKVVEETRKIVFVEGVEEQETVKKAGGALPLHQSTSSPRSVVKDQRDMTGGPDAAVDRPQRRKTKRQTTKEIERQKIEGKRQELVQRTRLKRQKAIERTKERIKQVSKAEDKLADQRARMGKSVVIGGITKDGRRFKIRQRRR